jgi:hypothetical protein
MRTTTTCGRVTLFTYSGSIEEGVVLHHNSGDVPVRAEFFNAILEKFRGRTVKGGFKMDDPPRDGFGCWVQEQSGALNRRQLTPRHGSFIAAVLRDAGYVECWMEERSVMLRFNS